MESEGGRVRVGRYWELIIDLFHLAIFQFASFFLNLFFIFLGFIELYIFLRPSLFLSPPLLPFPMVPMLPFTQEILSYNSYKRGETLKSGGFPSAVILSMQILYLQNSPKFYLANDISSWYPASVACLA